MRQSLPHTLVSFVLPNGVLLLAALALLRPTGLPKWTGLLILTYDYLVLVGAVVLSWYVGLSRVMISTLLLAIADGALSRFSGGGLTIGLGRTVFDAIALLLPINFLALSLIEDRRFVLRRDIVWLGAIVMQVCLVLWLCFSRRSPLAAAIAASLQFAFIDPGATRWTPLSQPALLAFGAGFVLVSARFVLQGSRLDRGFVWALMAMFLALHGTGLGWSPTNFLATAALILIVAVYADEYRLSHYDDVTGVQGRDAFYQALRDAGGPYALAVIDIDEMKPLNERYGDAIRDKTLRLVARKVSRLRGGKAFRYDRDKFAVLFYGKSAADVLPRLEALRAAIQGMSVPVGGAFHVLIKRRTRDPAPDQPLAVTVSIGVAEPSPNFSKSDQVFTRAEQALVRAKQAGRNEVRALA
jgi:diguanylate cyclase (GGDEF)-like protein